MPTLKLLQGGGDSLRRHALPWVFPELARLPPTARDRCLRRARKTEFDAFERVALVAGVTAAAYLLAPAAGQGSPMEQFLRHVAVFLQALPLLGIVAGPAYLRRIRRGLQTEVAAYRATNRKEASHESGHG